MRKIPYVLLAFFAIAIPFMLPNAARAEIASTGRSRLIVVPFENQSGRRSLDYLSWQLAENLAERFESEPGLHVLNGQFPLTTEAQAQTLDAPDGAIITAACDLAKKRGAGRLLTGYFGGAEWGMTLRVEIRDVADCRSDSLLGSGDASGDTRIPIKLKSGKMMPIVSTQRIQDLLDDATLLAFTRARVTLAPATMTALHTVSTTDSYANILMGRAVDRFLRPTDPNHHETALELAEHAVRVDPEFVEARRFYAFLLESKKDKNGKPQMAKARIHYEAVLAKRPNDVRSLIRLGHIEFEAGRVDVAKGYLTQATTARPDDPEPRYWLGETLLKLGDNDAATKVFEAVLDLEPDGLRARRRLAGLYAASGEYLVAAAALRFIVEAEPNDIDELLELAACLREAGKENLALAWYDEGAERFPKDTRPKRFAGYIREPPEAEDPAIGRFLIVAISKGRMAATLAESWRARFQRAANDAVLDLSLTAKEACVQDRGASSAIAARETREKFLTESDFLKRSATLVETARKKGEWAFLTSDQRALAGKMLDAAKATTTDVRETGTQLAGPVMGLVRRDKCDLTDLEATPPEIIAARDELRIVTMPKIAPARNLLAITPEVRAEAAKDTHYVIDNSQGSAAYEVIVDGVSVGSVEIGATMMRSAMTGYHAICLRGLDEGCAVGANVGRVVYLHEGLSIRIRHGGGPTGNVAIDED